jgi:hypothetical protein
VAILLESGDCGRHCHVAFNCACNGVNYEISKECAISVCSVEKEEAFSTEKSVNFCQTPRSHFLGKDNRHCI